MSIDMLLNKHHVDLHHARHVADLALTLFDSVRQAYDLPSKARRLLEIGALLHNVGLTTNPDQHHTIGRDIVLDAHLPELKNDERALVACLISFHRKKVRPESEPAYLHLRKKEQQLTLRLAALLRVADGLDYSQTQTTHILTCKLDSGEMLLHLTGPHARKNGARAVAKADLWHKVLESQVRVSADEAVPSSTGEEQQSEQDGLPHEESQPQSDANAISLPAVAFEAEPTQEQQARLMQYATATDSLADLCRRLLRRSFQKMLAQESDVHKDNDPEDVHAMRVATRRLRAILLIASEVGPQKPIRSFRKQIQHVAEVLGRVRDYDVFTNHVNGYRESLPEEQRAGLSPLTEALAHDRELAHASLLNQLSSKGYAAFKHDFATFLTDYSRAWKRTVRVRDLAGSIIWRHYESLRTYEQFINLSEMSDEMSDMLHEARITGKRLRYMLELVAEVASASADPTLDPLIALQECLGSLQDSVVAKTYVAKLRVHGNEAAEHALEAYVGHCEAERQALLTTLPTVWEQVIGLEYRRTLMEVLVTL